MLSVVCDLDVKYPVSALDYSHIADTAIYKDVEGTVRDAFSWGRVSVPLDLGRVVQISAGNLCHTSNLWSLFQQPKIREWWRILLFAHENPAEVSGRLGHCLSLWFMEMNFIEGRMRNKNFLQIHYIGFQQHPRQTFVQFLVGDSHTAALTELGAVYSWGVFRGNSGPYAFLPGKDFALQPELVYKPQSAQTQIVQIASGKLTPETTLTVL